MIRVSSMLDLEEELLEYLQCESERAHAFHSIDPSGSQSVYNHQLGDGANEYNSNCACYEPYSARPAASPYGAYYSHSNKLRFFAPTPPSPPLTPPPPPPTSRAPSTPSRYDELESLIHEWDAVVMRRDEGFSTLMLEKRA